jgi:hypothetical protein
LAAIHPAPQLEAQLFDVPDLQQDPSEQLNCQWHLCDEGAG